jgi:hypothetical protein
MIVSTIQNASQFRDEFHRCGRGSQFTYDALEILFEHLEQLSEDTGQNIEMDVIAICCDYAEDSPDEIAKNYNVDVEGLDWSDRADKVRDFLEEAGEYVGTTDHGLIVYRQF